ncbi:protein-tyrosine phosphatase-like protein [Morchella snyderi]|nr:protein-tyrosine phosphatase-like protein [Morchella snyderi]
MSMPATAFPKNAYRNPLSAVLKFLDAQHGDSWAIWEFRAEGTGYRDEDVYGRIYHAPFPDHHPPPFALIPSTVASMREHVRGGSDRVVVVHCKAGKGRSGTMSCSYLISEEGWTAAAAMAQFTRTRMRPNFGDGVSIPSQVRWVHYVERWARALNKTYIERRVAILEVHVWGLRDGLRVAVQGYVDEGKQIKTYHTFRKEEMSGDAGEGSAVVYRPKDPLVLATNDVNIDFEKRSKAAYGWSVLTSIAHVWFNAYFEGDDTSGVFTIDWEKMDGIRGTLRKGIKGFDRLQVVWKVVEGHDRPVREPEEGESIPTMRKASTKSLVERELGLQKDSRETEDGSPVSATTPVLKGEILQSTVRAEEASSGEETAAGEGGETGDGSGSGSSSEVIAAKMLPVEHSEEPYATKEHRIGSIKRKKHEDPSK